jgi:uncharacterized protein
MAPRFERDAPASGPIVRAIGPRGFKVDDGIYTALLLTPVRADGWTPPALDALAEADLAPLLALDPLPEFVILGTGATMVFPPRALERALEARGVGVEAMDSRAAARTWGVLRAEDRWIAAAIMPL